MAEVTTTTTAVTYEIGITTTKEEFVEKLNKDVEGQVGAAAYRGDQEGLARSSIQDLCCVFKKSQSNLNSTIGINSLFPLLIATDGEIEGNGTGFQLFRKDGSSELVKGSTPDYDLYKCLNKAPLGIFSILSQYFKAPQSTNWITPLQEVLTKVKDALNALKEAPAEFNKELGFHALQILKISEEYIETRIGAKEVTEDSFYKFGRDIYPHFVRGGEKAIQIQVETSIPALRKLKESLGEEWADLYVVIPAAWPSSAANPRRLILEHVMDKDNVDTRIIIAENVTTITEARTVAGRVVGQRAFAQLFFGSETEERKTFNFSVSTSRDYLTDLTVKAIEVFEAIKIVVETKESTIFEIDEEEAEPEPEPTKPTPKPKEEDPLGKFKNVVVEI
jgi:hypothetical protein